MIRYAGLDKNDILNGEGFCVSFWTQGCPHKCKGCHNPETWDFNGGIEIEYSQLINDIIQSISANGIIRNFSILGGEPLCKENLDLVDKIVTDIRKEYPTIKIYCWTGYNYEDIINNSQIKKILKKIDVLIDGLFILEQRDITLKLKGSLNQRVIDVKNTLLKKRIVLYE